MSLNYVAGHGWFAVIYRTGRGGWGLTIGEAMRNAFNAQFFGGNV